MREEFDFLVIGSGIAGLSFALKVANNGRVAVISKAKLDETNTAYAQGGIAAVTNNPDNYEKHIEDTMIAGDGVSNRDIRITSYNVCYTKLLRLHNLKGALSKVCIH